MLAPRAHDVLPGGGIARVARSFQPAGGACRAVQLGIVYFYHLISPFCVFIALAIAAVLSSCAGPLSLGAFGLFLHFQQTRQLSHPGLHLRQLLGEGAVLAHPLANLFDALKVHHFQRRQRGVGVGRGENDPS